jgi:cell division protein FtsQ
MQQVKRYSIKNILLTALWIAIGSAAVMLLVAAVKKKDEKLCRGIEINISGVSTNFFIDKNDVLKIIAAHTGSTTVGKPIEAFNLAAMEKALKKDVWIQEAELFFDNNEILQVAVEEREPVARIFTSGGNTFYIDSSNTMLPLSEKFSARLPVFTSFPSETKVLSKADSNLLNDIKKMSIRIQSDSFLMAMIDQVDITAQRNFELIPKLGGQVIVFGNATDLDGKFDKLLQFYKKVIMKMGWSRYSIINLQYKNQVVAKIRGADDVSADSLRTRQMMEIIAANAAKYAEDSTLNFKQDDRKNNDSSMIQQSIQRDEPGDNDGGDVLPVQKPLQQAVTQPVVKPVVKPAVSAPVKPVVKTAAKPVQAKKPAVIIKKKPVEKQTQKPKAAMPVKNEY